MLFGVGHPGVTSGARAFAGRLNVVWRRPVRGFAVVVRASQVAPLRLRAVECCFASVIRASQVAPLRLRRLTVVWRRLVRGVARRGAIYDARCRNGTIGRPRWASAYVACCGRFAVLYWPFCGIASVIRASRVAPLRLRRLNVVLCRPVCGFASVIRASQVAPVRLRGGRMLFCVGWFAA